jgi:hypothetical protein
MSKSKNSTSMPLAIATLALAIGWATAGCAGGASQSVAAGGTLTVEKTTRLAALELGSGAQLLAPGGKVLTLTVDGVETASAPGKYLGDIVISVNDDHPVNFAGMGSVGAKIHHFRQALFIDATGVVAGKSATSAAGHYSYANRVLSGAEIRSTGENFNGIVVTGGKQIIKGIKIDLQGNGGNDFAGFGAALLAQGKGTTLVVDGAQVHTRGVIRTGAVAEESSRLIVKNSEIAVRDGTLPAGYRSNVSFGEMLDAPWMLGIRGNARATNLLGDGTEANYINSDISSEGWGVLSVDNGSHARLTAINSKVSNVGQDGYGSYAIGESTNAFYGTEFNVKDYAQIITDGHVIYAASSAETVARLNQERQLELSADELKSLVPRETVIHSGRFGVMWHGGGSAIVRDGSIIETGKTSFLVKGASASIDVDGSKGAVLRPGNSVLVQTMDNDDPGPVDDHGLMANTGVYHEPTAAPGRRPDFDVAVAHESDVTVLLANIKVSGDLYNGMRGGPRPAFAGPGVPAAKPVGGSNLVVTLDHAQLTGVVSSSTTRHAKDTITAADFKLLGEVTNTASPAVNNGVLLKLRSAIWTVTGKSHVTVLDLDAASSIVAAEGKRVTLVVNGAAKPLKAGRYQGQLVLTVQ